MARRPEPRDRAGAVGVLGGPQQRLRVGERVRLVSNILNMSRVSFTNCIHGKGDMAQENAHNEGVEHGMKMGTFAFVRGDKKVPSCTVL